MKKTKKKQKPSGKKILNEEKQNLTKEAQNENGKKEK